MREIKFRAWHKANKEIISWEDLKGSWARESNDYGLQVFGRDDLELMQFTGLHDKNGKEIWEGDIIRWYSDKEKIPFIRQVEFFGPCFGYHSSTFQPLTFPMRYEVLGNIYENKELLK